MAGLLDLIQGGQGIGQKLPPWARPGQGDGGQLTPGFSPLGDQGEGQANPIEMPGFGGQWPSPLAGGKDGVQPLGYLDPTGGRGVPPGALRPAPIPNFDPTAHGGLLGSLVDGSTPGLDYLWSTPMGQLINGDATPWGAKPGRRR
jgi:hypothetical protein